ncbi:hypothetical protein HMPREF1863_00633 [Aedoeadaptatus coxii]|uniref:Uncharacterized protein n=1 Tax=Aedoeadaptatus coxii TaxID=755172 RepID=A0A134AHH6_9FIRM|nr:hypothetical protein [Peptoniphilus coxii]KXB67161.1 hypothetical protein HMPREF1863_00633 [Peptoniphilus coxii]
MTIERVLKKKTKIQKLESKIADMQEELEKLNDEYYANLGKEVEELFVEKELDLKDLVPLLNMMESSDEAYEINEEGGEDEIAN